MKYQSDKFPSLTKSYKNYYPFKIATTSFIYPELYVANVKMLGPYVDEIELLLFESAPVTTLLSKDIIEELIQLSQDLQVSYNIHLPTDLTISDSQIGRQRQAIDTLLSIIERTSPLLPTSNTLHIPCPANADNECNLKKWQDQVYRNLVKIISAGVPADKLAIETLDYPLEWLGDIIADLNLSVCLDIGHLIISGAEIKSEFDRFNKSISIIHLHGVQNRKDHDSLNKLPDTLFDTVIAELRKFSGTVSLEVFNFENLRSSLYCLKNKWVRMG